MSSDQKRERSPHNMDWSPSHKRPQKKARTWGGFMGGLASYIPLSFASFPRFWSSTVDLSASNSQSSHSGGGGSSSSSRDHRRHGYQGEPDAKQSPSALSRASTGWLFGRKSPKERNELGTRKKAGIDSANRRRRNSIDSRRRTPTFVRKRAENEQRMTKYSVPHARGLGSARARQARTRVIPAEARDSAHHYSHVEESHRDSSVDDLTQELHRLKLSLQRSYTEEQEERTSRIGAYQHEVHEEEERLKRAAQASQFSPKTRPLDDDEDERAVRLLEGPDVGRYVGELANIELTVGHLRCLGGSNWLSDEVMNFYMAMLEERSKRYCADASLPASQKVNAIFFNTFFFPKLAGRPHRDYKYKNVKRWTKKKKVDIFALDRVVLPVHVGENHWCLASLDMRNKVIEYYDSLFFPNPWALECLQRYIQDEYKDKKKKTYTEMGLWTVKIMERHEIPNQRNGCDCGVFTCMFADCLGEGRSFDFTQEDMPLLRQRMALAISQGYVDWNE